MSHLISDVTSTCTYYEKLTGDYMPILIYSKCIFLTADKTLVAKY